MSISERFNMPSMRRWSFGRIEELRKENLRRGANGTGWNIRKVMQALAAHNAATSPQRDKHLPLEMMVIRANL